MVWWRGLSRKRAVGPGWYREQGRIGTTVRLGSIVAARVRGRNGTYAVFGNPRALDCTCSARQLPCPHVVAVGAEHAEAPERFLDLTHLIAGRFDRAALERMLLSRPGLVLDAVERRDFGSLEMPVPIASAS